jgi:hypothetical protein
MSERRPRLRTILAALLVRPATKLLMRLLPGLVVVAAVVGGLIGTGRRLRDSLQTLTYLSALVVFGGVVALVVYLATG